MPFFTQKFWDAAVSEDGHSVTFNIVSSDSDQCYPGEVHASVLYHLNDENELKVTLKAVVEGHPTIINITSHPYFNLSGTQKVCIKSKFND